MSNLPQASLAADGFTAWAPDIGSSVSQRLRDLLGIPASCKATQQGWSKDLPKNGPDFVAVDIDTPSGKRLTLEIFRHPQDRPYYSSPWMDLGYQVGPSDQSPLDDPELASLLKVIVATVDRRKTDGSLEPKVADLFRDLAEAADARLVSDWMFREAPEEADRGQGFLRLGFRCNQDCYFCWQARDWPSPSGEYYFRWLDELATRGIRTLTITGGEPTLHVDLPALVERATEVHGLTVQLETNAIRFRKPTFLKRLVDAGLKGAFVSYHSADPKISDAMTRAPGTHEGTVAGVSALVGAGITVTLNCVVEARNYQGLAQHAETIVAKWVTPNRGKRIRGVVYSNPSIYQDHDAYEGGLLPLDVLRDPIIQAARILRAAGVEVETVGTCGFPPCLFSSEPSLLKPISVNTQNDRTIDGRGYVAVCNDCAARRDCLGQRTEYIARFGDRGLIPLDANTWKRGRRAATRWLR